MDDKWTIFEPKSGRYFKASFDTVMTTISYLNKRIENEALIWNDIFRAFGLSALDVGKLPIDCDKISSHLDFGFESGSFAPLTVIDYIKN